MRKKSMFTRSAAFLMAAAIGITATGCGTSGQTGSDENVLNEAGTQASVTEESQSGTEQKDSADGNGMGRYVETTVSECDGFMDQVVTQNLSDGQIVFLNSLSNQKIVSNDGDVWDAEADEPFFAFIEEHYPAETAIAKDGTIAVVGMDKRADLPDGVNEYDYNLYIYNTDNTTKQIPVEMPDADSTLRALAFDEQGTLYAYASGCRNIYKIDIHEETAEKLVTLEDTYLMQCRDNILMCMTFEKIFLYDLEKKSFIEDETLDSFIEENIGEMAWTGGGYTAYAFLGADNTIYMAGDKGLYRHVIEGSAVEQVIDGSLSSLGDPTYSIMAMTVNDRNEFFAAYNSGKIVKFVYDAAVPSVPNDKITVYSLSDDDLVKQTISAYQTQYPDMFIEYQIGMDEGGVTREDALKKLNTQILSGSGPDVIMLDGINIDTYAEKGVLMDLSDIVDEVDQKDGLYRNLIEEIRIDDKIYAVPAKFYIPVICGNAEYVDSVKDYKSMADMVERAGEQYATDISMLMACSARGIMKRFMPVCAPSWKNEKGELDQNRIREFLEQSKRLYDVTMNTTSQEYIAMYQQNVIDSAGENYEDSNYFMMMSDTQYLMQAAPFAYGEIVDAYSYRDILSLPRAEGLEDTFIKLLNGQSSNVYHPASIAGINAATKNPDAAKQFVSMMLGATVQETLQFGLPVNKKALPAQFAYDESELGDDGGQFYMSSSTKDGESFQYTIYPVQQDGIDKLESWIAQLDTPYLCDTVLETVVYAEGAKYLEGTQDIDAAVKAIADSVEIYLYE